MHANSPCRARQNAALGPRMVVAVPVKAGNRSRFFASAQAIRRAVQNCASDLIGALSIGFILRITVGNAACTFHKLVRVGPVTRDDVGRCPQRMPRLVAEVEVTLPQPPPRAEPVEVRSHTSAVVRQAHYGIGDGGNAQECASSLVQQTPVAALARPDALRHCTARIAERVVSIAQRMDTVKKATRREDDAHAPLHPPAASRHRRRGHRYRHHQAADAAAGARISRPAWTNMPCWCSPART